MNWRKTATRVSKGMTKGTEKRGFEMRGEDSKKREVSHGFPGGEAFESLLLFKTPNRGLTNASCLLLSPALDLESEGSLLLLRSSAISSSIALLVSSASSASSFWSS
jgi:hypothetical protein